MLIFFFKQKTAYEMRISDWSSDVCSSDLPSRGYSSCLDALRALPYSFARGEGDVMQASMTAAEVMQLELQLAGRVSLLQFGCGNSTLVAARQAQKIVCVDGDARRLAEVGANLEIGRAHV